MPLVFVKNNLKWNLKRSKQNCSCPIVAIGEKIAKTKKNWLWPNIAIAKKIIFLA